MNYLGLIVLRGVTTGGGEAFYYPAATSLLSQYHVNTRALALSVYQTALYVGIIASGFIAAYIGEHFGWKSSFFVFGAGGLFVAIYIIYRLKNVALANASIRGIPLHIVFKSAFSKKTVWLLCLAFGCMVFVNIGYTTWMPTFYHEKFGLSLSVSGFTSMFFHFAFAFIGVIIGGRLSDKMALRNKDIRMKIESLSLLCGFPFIFIMGYTDNLIVSYTALSLFGFFRGLYDSNLNAAFLDVVEPRFRSTSVGIMTAFAFVIGSLSPMFLGIIKSLYGLSFGISSLSVFYVIGFMLIWFALKKYFDKDYCNEAVE